MMVTLSLQEQSRSNAYDLRLHIDITGNQSPVLDHPVENRTTISAHALVPDKYTKLVSKATQNAIVLIEHAFIQQLKTLVAAMW